MKLTIDGKACFLGRQRVAVPAYEAAKLADIRAARNGRSQEITIPAVPQNDIIIGFARDPQAMQFFNAELHTAELSCDGAVLLAGTVRLLSASDGGYTLEIRSGGARWASKAAQRMFNTLGLDYTASLIPSTICDSWTNASPVKFFPIHRDEYPQQSNSSDLLTAERILSVDDYHPFLHVDTLVRKIFADAGYTVDSRFMESDTYTRLYMSGSYATGDTVGLASKMGFYARRIAPKTAVANSSGRVYADPKALFNTIGNIVETATPQALDADGKYIPGLVNNGGCFSVDDGQIVFTPTTSVSVGFEYHLKYTTGHRILSRTRLKGIDSVYLGANADIAFTLANRYEDRRAQMRANFSYRAIVFGHAAGAQYRLTYTKNGVAGSVWTEFSARTALVTTASTGTYSNPVLQVKSGTSWGTYTGDWALYDGYITETGETTVEMRVRTAAEPLSPSSPKHFNQIYFYGGEAGMSLTLHKECSLRTRFVSSPGHGSTIHFADVACHNVRQSALLEALQHMFNLRFHTEEATDTVRIEPYDDFFNGPEVDWRHRTDFSQEVTITDTSSEVHERRTWGYQAPDGPVRRSNSAEERVLGQWSADTASYAALQGEKVFTNPLFRPTLNSLGHYANAPSASIMQVGDRDAAEEEGAGPIPRIVRFPGLGDLPQNERWGSPWNKPSYPLAGFCFEGNEWDSDFSLGFENRGGSPGLHTYYDNQIAQEASRGRVTLSLRIAPHEYEALFSPGTGAPDIRSVFRLDTGRGEVRATLHAIDKYDPAAASVRCTFNRLTTD